jgi:hypothetical protein
MRTLLRKAVAASTFPPLLVLSLAVVQAPRCYAQTQAQPVAPAKVAALNEPPAASDVSTAQPAPPPDPVAVDIAKELAAMKARIEVLEAELKRHTAAATAASPAALPPARVALALPAAVPTAAPARAVAQMASDSSSSTVVPPTKKLKIDLFSDWDRTWLNSNPRNKDVAFDSKFWKQSSSGWTRTMTESWTLKN